MRQSDDLRWLNEATLYSPTDAIAEFTQNPVESGVYAWWFSSFGNIPIDGCRERDGKFLLYVGHGKPIGVLFDYPLRLRHPESKSKWFGEMEAELTNWLHKHSAICWLSLSDPKNCENQIIRAESLPLNLDRNQKHPFHPQLTMLRKKARIEAGLCK